MEQIHNLYITSQNKSGNDTNYNYNLYLSNYGINIAPDEDAYININSFQTLNSFYNINDNSKNFTIKIRTDQDVNFTYSFSLDDGNYNIYEFMNSINAICGNFITMSYNERKNKYNYISNQSLNTSVFLMPNSYNYKYFGFKPNVYTEILTPINGIGTYSNIINMNNFCLIVIKVIGLVEQNKSIDNFNTTINRGDICCIVNRQDISTNALINWCDINKSFIKKINNNEINQLTFIFTNEYNKILEDINDWVITIQITIKKR